MPDPQLPDTVNVPSEISNDQLFGIRPASEMYTCPKCDRQFMLLARFEEHFWEGCDD